MGNNGSRPILVTDQVQLDHFKLLRVVGKGAFGKVRIVERKDTGLTFALKYIRKDEVVRAENVRNIVKERRMLEHLNHPFLCNLRYSFQDFEYIYIVVDLMNGGDLRFHISRKTFSEDAIRFWIAELGCALRYIHSQGICHRDVKPDNVLLDSEGHVHLADFNVASDIKPNRPLVSRSGTLAYLAPEVFEGKYSSEVDWWSLGVLFYECVYSRRPFEAISTEELSQKIRQANPKYPHTDPPVTTSCVSAMQKLLERRIIERIGGNGFSSFVNHPFFQPIDFEALEQLQIKPIFVPSSAKTNFDATYDLEELLLEEAPLEARAKHQKPRQQPRADATPQELRAAELYKSIEQLFEPFNYLQASYEDDRYRNAQGGTSRSASRGRATGTHSAGTATPVQGHETSLATIPSGEEPFFLKKEWNTTQSSYTTTSNPGSPPLSGQISLSAIVPTSSFTLDESTPAEKLPSPTSGSFRGIQSQAANAPPIPLRHPGRSRSIGNDGAKTWNEALQQKPGMGQSSSDAHEDPSKRRDTGRPAGVLGFLARNKKGRDKSPRPRAENGVIGKDGARVVIG